MTFFAAVWLPLMIIPCPLIKSIYLSSIRDRRSKKKKKKKEAISQSSFGRHHLAVMRQLAREEVLGGCWNINTDTVWVKVTSLNLISCSSQAFPPPPVLYITVNIFFLLWLRAGLFSKREPNGLRRSHRVRLLRGAASRVFAVRPGSSSVCQTLREVCLSLLGHQMGGVYGIRRHHERQDVHTFAMKYLKVSFFWLTAHLKTTHLVKLIEQKLFFLMYFLSQICEKYWKTLIIHSLILSFL